MDFRKFLEMISEESTSQKDNKAEKAGRKVAKDIEYDEGHKGKDDERAEEAGEKVTKDIEYDDKKDKKKKKSLKDWFEQIDKKIVNEAEQLSIVPAKQSTQLIKKGEQVIGSVTNPALAATIKSAIGKGEMSIADKALKEEPMMEKAPPGMEDVVLSLKKKFPGEEGRAYAIAWSMYNKKHGKNEAAEDNPDSAMIEADIPHSGPDYGAGLGAGRSDKVLEAKPDFLDLDKDGNKKETMKKAAADKKTKVKESMNTLEAAYHEGKSHGLSKHGYACRYNEGSEEHKRYHDGFKEGLDECYGLMPNRGLVVDETGMPPATVPGMASQEMEDSDLLDEVFFFDKPTGPRTPDQQRARNLPQDTLSQRGGRNTPAMGGQGYKDMVRGTGPFGQTAKDIYGIRGPKGNLPEADLDEMNKTEYMKHKARTTPGDTFKAFGQTMHDKDVLETEMFAFESLDKQLNALLNESAEVVNEGISVNMSQGLGGPGAEDSVSVTAQGEDAAKLLAFIKQVGLGGLGAEKTEEPAAAIVATSDYGAPKFQGHDAMVKLMKLAGGDDYEHEMDHGAVAQAKPCGMHGVAEAECGCGKGKEMVDEVESEDQMEYQVAEDDGEGNIEADEQGAQIDAALAVGSENEKNVTEGGDGMEGSPEAAGAVAAADAEEEQEEAMSESEKLDEWANDAGKDGTEQAFMRDIEFMTKVISGGLNKPKVTGQTTIPVIASQNARNGDEDVSAWKKLAGIKK